MLENNIFSKIISSNYVSGYDTVVDYKPLQLVNMLSVFYTYIIIFIDNLVYFEDTEKIFSNRAIIEIFICIHVKT